MLRVVKPQGLILWYDFRYNNPRNPNVQGIGATEIRGLSPGRQVELRKVTLAPPPCADPRAYLLDGRACL